MTAPVELVRGQSLAGTARATLGQVCTFKNGGTPTKTKPDYFEGDIPWITGADITSPTVNEARSRITQSAVTGSATNVVPRGSILLVTRTSVGKVATAGMELAFSQDITSLHPNSDILDNSYLLHFLKSKADYFKQNARGATIRGITREVVTRLSIPLPPLEEQRRIAAILDKADELRIKRRRTLIYLDAFKRSLFDTMFGDPIYNERNWQSHRVSDFISDAIGGKNIVGAVDVYGGHRVLKISALTSLRFNPAETKPLPADYLPPHSHIVRSGDLLFSRANTSELVGATVLVRSAPENVALPDKIWRLVRDPSLPTEPRFVESLFQHGSFRSQVSTLASGSSGSMKNISKPKLFGIETVVPPVELQRTFAKRIEAAERIADDSRRQLAELDALFASLQHRAFEGEL